MTKQFLFAVTAGLAFLAASSARAHIRVESPTPRYVVTSTENKACPCGEGTSNRDCDVPEERSDPNRSPEDQVTTLVAGSELVFRFDEYVGHSGRYRIAFDEDGADLDDFNANPLIDIPDPPGSAGNIGEGRIWEIAITVPNTPCDNCTLQLIQMMDGNMTEPVADPVGRGTYYACADIRIVAGDGSSATPGGEGQGGSAAEGTATAGSSGSDADGEGTELGEGAEDIDDLADDVTPRPSTESGACSFAPRSRWAAGVGAGGALTLLAASLLLRRRRE